MRQETRDTNEAEAARTPRVSQPASRVSRHVSRVSRLASEAPYSFTFKAWPVVALATIGLCYLTQTVAGWFGISLPDQQNIEIVRRCLTQAFASAKHFGVAAFLVLQVVVLLPVAEELVFRGLLFRLPQRAWRKVGGRKGERRETGDERARDARRETREEGQSTNAQTSKRPNHSTIRPFGHLTIRLIPHSIIRPFDYSIIFLSSLLFSAAHYLAQPWPDAAFLALFFFGAAQCWLYLKTGRIVCAMLNHALFNLTNLVLLFVLPKA